MPKLQRPEPGHPRLITIGENIFECRLNLGLMKQLDIEHGINLLKPNALVEVIQSPEKLALVLYYSLKNKQPTITLEWVEENVEPAMLIEVVPPLIHTVNGQWPDKPAAEVAPENPLPEPEPDEEPVLTGSRSGPSAATISDSANGKSGG